MRLLKNTLTFIFCSMVIALTHAEHKLVDIQKVNPTIKLDIKYATPNNFAKKAVYPIAKCYLIKEVAEKLDAVQKELQEKKLGLLVWDGYRPLSVQKIFWDLVPDERYVANPAKGSRHNRGCAVDCTLIKEDGSPVEMPTDFDDLTEKAHRDNQNCSEEAKKNRALLEEVMTKHGFVGLPTEWWHFDYVGWEQYPILDLSFEELAQ